MKINKKVIIVMLIICLSILLLFILYKNNQINFIEKIFNQNQRNTNDGISYRIYDNQQIDALQVVVTIKRENGIEKIIYDNNGKEVTLNCNGKTKVSIDIETTLDKEHIFEVTSEGQTISEQLLITNEAYHEHLDNLIDMTIEEKKATIKFSAIFNSRNNETNYYKIGETGTWTKYTGKVSIDKLSIDSRNYETEDKQYIQKIYTKQVDAGGNTLINSLEVEVTKSIQLDVFNDVTAQGKTLAEYGFTASWVNGQNAVFTIGEFRAGHGSGRANWSGTFRWNNPNVLGAERLYVNFYQWHNGYSTAYSQLTVVYQDGTSASKSNGNAVGNYPLTIDLEDKQISYVQMYLYGLDDHGTSSWACVNSIILQGIDLPENE